MGVVDFERMHRTRILHLGEFLTRFPPPKELSQIDPNADLKSPISLVHEIALKRSFTVVFEVVRESGPPHMRTFVTTCTVGELRSQGEGTGKKVGSFVSITFGLWLREKISADNEMVCFSCYIFELAKKAVLSVG